MLWTNFQTYWHPRSISLKNEIYLWKYSNISQILFRSLGSIVFYHFKWIFYQFLDSFWYTLLINIKNHSYDWVGEVRFIIIKKILSISSKIKSYTRKLLPYNIVIAFSSSSSLCPIQLRSPNLIFCPPHIHLFITIHPLTLYSLISSILASIRIFFSLHFSQTCFHTDLLYLTI